MPKFKDASLPAAVRAEDLLSRMTLEQKIAQLQCMMGGDIAKDFPQGVGEVSALMLMASDAKGVAKQIRAMQEQVMAQTEFGIPAIMHVEALSGGIFPSSTSFPAAIAQAATWEPELLENMTTATRKQMRAVGIRQGLSPVMDVSRDPRWGRQGETYGEDPALCAAMSVAFVRGLQGGGDVIATAKHFIGYGYSEGGLNCSTCDIPDRRLREVFAKPFQAAVTEAHLRSVMNSYGSINGEPVITSKKLLTGLLRDEMKFTGITVSDYMSVMHPFMRYRTAEDYADAGVQALEAGMDNEMPSPVGYTTAGLMAKVKSGELDPELIDRSCRRMLEAKFAIGLFENPYPDMDAVEREFNMPEYEAASLEMARKTMVLLKNDGTLPLCKDIKKIAVIGPHAESCRALFGCYTYGGMIEMMINIMGSMSTGMAGVESPYEDTGFDISEIAGAMGSTTSEKYPDSKIAKENPLVEQMLHQHFPDIKNLLEQLRADYPNAQINYAHGYDIAGSDRSGFDAAYDIAKDADIVIVTVGGKYGWGMGCTTGEGADTCDINLPGVQEEFLTGLAKLNKKYVAVHFEGHPVSSEELDRSAAAILEAWSPARYGAKAIVETLFGDNNPGGRLPVTAARQAGQIPIYYGFEHGVSYGGGMDLGFGGYTDETFFPRYFFGFGLSYTKFEYSDLVVRKGKLNPYDELTVSVDVKNTGDRAGDEVVQLYVSDSCASVVRPSLELAGFKRVTLAPGEKKTVTFTCKVSQFAFLDADMRWKVEAGNMELKVGAASNDIRLEGSFVIERDGFVEGSTRGFFAEASVK